MSGADILVVILVTIIMLAILFFSFIFPHLNNKSGHCSSCPANKPSKIKRAFKAYHKKNK